MDVANYLSELLMQNGEVNVPGLGYFAQLKVDGYYDNTQNKFYPPTNKVQFDQQYIDDDVLLQYIADKKKISLASSKYFTAKFIDNLRQEAMVKEVPLADLGTLHFEETKLHFKPTAVLPVDPAYYGYQPVEISKLGGTSFNEQMEKEMPRSTSVSVPPLPNPEPAVPIGAPQTGQSDIFIPQPAYNAQQEAKPEEEFIFNGRGYSDEEETVKNNNWIWITIIMIVVLGILGALALYKLKPDTFNRLIGAQQPAPIILKALVKHDTMKTVDPVVKADSTAKKITVDTTAKAASVNKPTSGVDSTKERFEVIGTSTEDLTAAYKAIANYKSLGIEAHIVDLTPGKRKFKVSLGTYATLAEARDAINELVKTGKVKPGIWPLQINPKK
ncbi:HU domain-containing protein [Mucilaginibacter sp.]